MAKRRHEVTASPSLMKRNGGTKLRKKDNPTREANHEMNGSPIEMPASSKARPVRPSARPRIAARKDVYVCVCVLACVNLALSQCVVFVQT